jgi:predicted DNA-binding transcriptional regulator AlpA
MHTEPSPTGQATHKPARPLKVTPEQIAAAADPDALLSIDTVCVLTGMSRTTLRLKVKEGTFPAPSHQNRRVVRWPAHKVRAYLQARTRDITLPASA